jgi:predicted DNA-binding protein
MKTSPHLRIPQRKTTRQDIRLEPRQHARLQAMAEQHQTTMSALIRLAIDRLLEEEDAAAEGS